MGFKNWSLRSKILIPMILITIITVTSLGFWVRSQQNDLVIQQARLTANAISKQILADRQVYTEKVVNKLKKDGLEIQARNLDNFRKHKGGILLPASFVHATSKVVNALGTHKADLLSLWNLNPNKGPRNAFEREALKSLIGNKKGIKETVVGTGRDARYIQVSADVGSARACITCHNAHPKSTKRDFKLGDVMGGIVVSMPVGKAFQKAQSNTYILTGSLLGVLFLILLIIGGIQWRFVSRPLVDLEKAADRISMGDVDEPIQISSNDEVGKLGKAFERMRVSLERMMKELDDD